MNEELLKLQGEVVELTRIMKEKADKDQTSEVKELGDKLAALQAEVKAADQRKMRFDVGPNMDAQMKREIDSKMDELFIAAALCCDAKTGKMNRSAYNKIVTSKEYAVPVEVIKASGFDFGGATTADGDGGDFIPPGFSNTMMTDIFLALEIAGQFARINMPTPTFTFPFSATRITARKGAEVTAVTKDEIVTSDIIFTAKKLMASIDFSNELEQDAIAVLLPFIRERVVEAFALGQEKIALNGDTTDTLNGGIGVVAADDARRVQKGIRSLLNAGEKVSLATGGITEANLGSLRIPMGKYGKSPSDLFYVLSMSDYLKTLNATNFPNYQALHTYGQNAVILKGEMGRLNNIPLVVTELIPTNLDADGIYNAAGTKTTCLLINKKAYMWGDRKQFAMETFYNPNIQATTLIGSERLDFKKVLPAAAPTAVAGVNY